MIAVDTNVLVYAHRKDSPWHDAGSELLQELSQGIEAWAIPWPCIHEFLAIVTHRRIYQPPSSLSRALGQVDAWFESPSLQLLAESGTYWRQLRQVLKKGRISGAQTHDARVVALCRHHGVKELWSADRDFGRFQDLTVRNPLI